MQKVHSWKTHRRKAGEGYIHRFLKRNPHITGNLQCHTHVQGFTHDQGKLPADPETVWKKEVKTKEELPTAWLSVEGMPQHIHRALGKD